jgi:hypothetical protein
MKKSCCAWSVRCLVPFSVVLWSSYSLHLSHGCSIWSRCCQYVCRSMWANFDGICSTRSALRSYMEIRINCTLFSSITHCRRRRCHLSIGYRLERSLIPRSRLLIYCNKNFTRWKTYGSGGDGRGVRMRRSSSDNPGMVDMEGITSSVILTYYYCYLLYRMYDRNISLLNWYWTE